MFVDRCPTLDFPRPMPPSSVYMLGAGLKSEEPTPIMSQNVARFVEGAQAGKANPLDKIRHPRSKA